MGLKHTTVAICFLLIVLGLKPGFAASGFVIKKCRGANGEWYYGDTADRACAHSKVTELTDSGIKTKELAAPPTAAQLKEDAGALAKSKKAKELAKARARRDRILLSMYASAGDITYVRDRKISDINGLIVGEQDTLKSLQATLPRLQAQETVEASTDKSMAAETARIIANTKAQIATHEANIQKDQREIAAVRKQAAADLVRFQKLKDQSPAIAAAP